MYFLTRDCLLKVQHHCQVVSLNGSQVDSISSLPIEEELENLVQSLSHENKTIRHLLEKAIISVQTT